MFEYSADVRPGRDSGAILCEACCRDTMQEATAYAVGRASEAAASFTRTSGPVVRMTQGWPRPVVIGAPRSGFSLLCTVVSTLTGFAPSGITLRQRVLNAIIDLLGDALANTIRRAFASCGITDDLIFNDNFAKLVGGPKWLSPRDPEKACIRKYVGVRGRGDFTLVIELPRVVLEFDQVVHSHANPALWLTHPGYTEYTKLTSVRNPVAIINSSLFSINALTSEYIQRFLPLGSDSDDMRQALALYKFTDLDFFEGIARFYRRYFDEFIPTRHEYGIMRWEDLIARPMQTIVRVGRNLGIPISPELATEIWQRIGHTNLTGAHKHNFRRGHGIVGDELNYMTNTHLDILREMGFEQDCEALGYGTIPTLSEASFSEFQRRVIDLVSRGKVFRDFDDPDLFGFAFNKSNLDSSKFNFRRYDWRKATQIERSAFQDEAILEEVWCATDAVVAVLGRIFEVCLAGDYSLEASAVVAIRQIRESAAELTPLMPNAVAALENTLTSLVRRVHQDGILDDRPPTLMRQGRSHNLVAFRGHFVIVPQSAGTIDFTSTDPISVAGLEIRDDLASAEAVWKSAEVAVVVPASQHTDVPILVESHEQYNVVRIGNTFWGVPQSLGPLDLTPETVGGLPDIISGESIADVIAKIDLRP